MTMTQARPLGRPREFDETEALEAILGVFWARGFEGATTNDLAAATGLKKGSLYAAFGDKRLMYDRALAHYDRTRIDGTVAALAGEGAEGDGPPLARIEAFLSAAMASDDAGCFLCNASIDQAALDPVAAQTVRAGFGRLEAALATAVTAHWSETGGPAHKAKQVRRQAHHLMTVYFGLRVLAKAGAAPKTLKDAKRAALASLTAS